MRNLKVLCVTVLMAGMGVVCACEVKDGVDECGAHQAIKDTSEPAGDFCDVEAHQKAVEAARRLRANRMDGKPSLSEGGGETQLFDQGSVEVIDSCNPKSQDEFSLGN